MHYFIGILKWIDIPFALKRTLFARSIWGLYLISISKFINKIFLVILWIILCYHNYNVLIRLLLDLKYCMLLRFIFWQNSNSKSSGEMTVFLRFYTQTCRNLPISIYRINYSAIIDIVFILETANIPRYGLNILLNIFSH